jgi:exodeoxyribonuclease VII small subunit
MNNKTATPEPEGRKLTYLEAVEDLARIISSMEQGNLDIDQLAAQTKAANERVQYCREALHEIEQNVNELMKANALYTKSIPQP